MKRLSSVQKTPQTKFFFWIFILCVLHSFYTAAENTDVNEHLVSVQTPIKKKNGGESPVFECKVDDKDCEKDKLGLEAIKTLHHLIDDDQNGNVDQSESDEFLRDELQYTDGFERQALFHNNDKLISVEDLWKAWKHSVVYNWTVDDVLEWLIQDVDLPQYKQAFHNNGIDGSVLPRLVNATGPLLSSLGIRNPVHKQKLSLKAMDTVLFGAPKRVHSYAKDLLLISSLIIAIGGCWFACLHHRYSQTQVKKMMKDLESLQKAEDALKKLSKELADAEKNQISMPHDKSEELRILRPEERNWQNSIRLKIPQVATGEKSPVSLSREGSILRRKEGERKLQQAEEELASLREALTEAENRLEIQQQLESQWSVPGELQAWLQLTHELEQIHYNAKRQAAERQLMLARDGCDKIKKRNKAFFGSLRMAHSNSLDDIDQSILDARAALEEVKQDLQERLHRWHTIELLCGFSVISNPGLLALRQALGRDPGGNLSTRLPGSLLAPVSIDEADEDLPPTAFLSTLQTLQNANTACSRPRALSADENNETENIYNQIPERQRQQIFAWARRSRLNNWMRNKVATNGYTGAPLAPSGKSSTFLKQQTQDGSTGSLSHVGKAQPSVSHSIPMLARRGSRDNNLQDFVPTPPVVSLNTSPSTVSFHLGESPYQHERSQSNGSLAHIANRPSFTQSHSYTPYVGQSTSSPPAVSPSLSKVNSSGQLLASNTIPRNGQSSFKMYSSVSGNHLTPQTSPATTPGQETAEPKIVRSDSRDILNNNLNSFNHNQLVTSTPGGPALKVVNAQHVLTMNNHLEDSDATSLDSLPRTLNLSSIPKSFNDRSPDQDVSSVETDSLFGKEGSPVSDGPEPVSEKRQSKKKKFLPKFLQKHKVKTS
ncbi:stromal interaction molecule 2-like isoform X2 [Biomphalaria glabrata]